MNECAYGVPNNMSIKNWLKPIKKTQQGLVV